MLTKSPKNLYLIGAGVLTTDPDPGESKSPYHFFIQPIMTDPAGLPDHLARGKLAAEAKEHDHEITRIATVLIPDLDKVALTEPANAKWEVGEKGDGWGIVGVRDYPRGDHSEPIAKKKVAKREAPEGKHQYFVTISMMTDGIEKLTHRVVTTSGVNMAVWVALSNESHHKDAGWCFPKWDNASRIGRPWVDGVWNYKAIKVGRIPPDFADAFNKFRGV